MVKLEVVIELFTQVDAFSARTFTISADRR
jgi:hypothetical protein